MVYAFPTLRLASTSISGYKPQPWEIFMNLDELRKRLSKIDKDLISLIAQRQNVVAEIGEYKINTGTATRDYAREREVLEDTKQQAKALGLEPEIAEQVMTKLISASLEQQERSRVAAESSGEGQTALIIGGAGKMGGWMAEFLASQGYQIELADPVKSELSFPQIFDWSQSSLEHEIIVVAAPLKVTSDILSAIADRRPKGLIVDVGSLKTPLKDAFEVLVASGCRVTSIHPMFGPDTRLLSGRHVIFVDVGVKDATKEARSLFGSTMAELINMNLTEHDRLIAYVLGLSHALNLAFFTALAESGELVPHLNRLSSTTFDAQLEVASRVAKDNPQLYFEIQTLNRYGRAPLDALREAVGRIQALVETKDESGFISLMETGKEYLGLMSDE